MENEYIVTPSGELIPANELCHWGIKGMKWGIRRYQNKDGSLTPAGKKRAESDNDAKKTNDIDDMAERDARINGYLSKLSNKNESDVSKRDRDCFIGDIRTLLTQVYPDDISSKNDNDIKETATFLETCWKYEVDEATREAASGIPSRIGGDPLLEVVSTYYNTYVKNSPDEYAKCVLEEIERRNLKHSDSIEFTDDELAHYGTKGMKWGVRRYQNKDGSLTTAGKKRYAKLEAEMETLKPKKNSKVEETGKTERKKTVSEMSDDELREVTNRMQLESNYYNAAKSLAAANPARVSNGQKFMNGLMKDVVAPAAKNAGKEWLEKTMKDKLGLNAKDIDPVKKLENEYKTLELKQKIKRIKDKDPDDDLSWDERNKKQTYEWNEYLHERERQKHKKEDAEK